MTGPAAAVDSPLWALTVSQASARVARGELSPVELLEAVLARIQEVDDRIHSYIRVAAPQAREAAALAQAEIAAGRWRGPLHGLPFGVKDNYDVAGMPATAGSRGVAGQLAIAAGSRRSYSRLTTA